MTKFSSLARARVIAPEGGAWGGGASGGAGEGAAGVDVLMVSSSQGICQAAPGFPSLFINALESLGVSEYPRYYSREYEHRCKDHRGVRP